MNTVTLKLNGSIDHNETRVRSDILNFLSSQIELEAGYRLRSFFQMLDRYRLLVDLNTFFPTYIELYLNCPQAGGAAGPP